MAEQFNPRPTPFLTNWQRWSVTQSQLEQDCIRACRCLQAILRDAERLDAAAFNLNTQSILSLLHYYERALFEVFGLPNPSAAHQQAFVDFSNELNQFRQRALNGRFDPAPPQIPSSTATELLLRLLLEKAPRSWNGNPTITSIGRCSIKAQRYVSDCLPF